ncbi:MAG: hypothetical protein JWO44_988 [Bacteroidetes bacterium]|nr:hypothetical protein [Bacteroidota bacterium]
MSNNNRLQIITLFFQKKLENLMLCQEITALIMGDIQVNHLKKV